MSCENLIIYVDITLDVQWQHHLNPLSGAKAERDLYDIKLAVTNGVVSA
jgi:hypothetical protein